MKGLWQFIRSRAFLKHLFFYLIFVSTVCFLVSFWLSSYTSHGETIKVPNFIGVRVGELDKFVVDKGVRFVVIDSIYDVKSPKGTVIRQEPIVGEAVKENRIIYLYVNSIAPPQVVMPKLVDRSLRQAQAMLTTFGLKLGEIKFIADQCANCVLEQVVRGKKILPGEVVAKGTVVSLVVGKGLGDEEVGIPCLYGLTKREALARLADESLSVGFTKFDEVKDSAVAKVYRQTPKCGKDRVLKMGAVVDLYLTTNVDKIPKVASDTTTLNSKNDENDDK